MYNLNALKHIFASQGFRHGPLSLHPWQIKLYFEIPADRHLAVFTIPTYKDNNTFDQWVLLAVSCLGRCKMTAPSVIIFDCINVMLPCSIVSCDLIGRS